MTFILVDDEKRCNFCVYWTGMRKKNDEFVYVDAESAEWGICGILSLEGIYDKEQTKSFPKERFWLFSNPIKICLLRLIAEGIFHIYPHSMVPTGLGIRLDGQLFIYVAIGILSVSKGMFFILLMGIINVLL